MREIERTLAQLTLTGNLRTIPADSEPGMVDLAANDYLGLAADRDLRADFLRTLTADTFLPTSSASRLLAGPQKAYAELEDMLGLLYGRPALLFNSGYHANTGMIAALGSPHTLFVADKLVHASIIDGLKLSGADFRRFRHNDTGHLRRIVDEHGRRYDRVVIVAESVYSMDGDRADIEGLINAKSLHANAMLYLDEAHAVGVCGDRGLGLGAGHPEIDILVGTFGKALASEGAFAIMSPTLRSYMINCCRSLIFSTAIPPVQALWTMTTLRRALAMDAERQRLSALATHLAGALGPEVTPSQIIPYIVGSADRAVALSASLREEGIKVLPIRTPTVPAGTERLRFSLSAALTDTDMQRVTESLRKNLTTNQNK